MLAIPNSETEGMLAIKQAKCAIIEGICGVGECLTVVSRCNVDVN